MNTINKITIGGTTYGIIDTNTVTSINGKTGSIAAADIATVLTAAGYKLTDTDTNTVTSINGKTGAIAASDIATVLTSAGYKLTDADTNTWRPVQCNSTDIGSNTLNLVAGSNVTLSRSNGTITINSSYTDTNTWRPLGTTADTACAGNDSRLSDSRPASDVYSWAKASTKPTYIANEVMSISTVAISANTSSSCSITGSGNAGKAQTIIYTNSGSADYTVTVPTDYKTPDGAAIELTCKAGGYCEVSYLNIGGTIYARGL